jgi:hypothetical protein
LEATGRGKNSPFLCLVSQRQRGDIRGAAHEKEGKLGAKERERAQKKNVPPFPSFSLLFYFIGISDARRYYRAICGRAISCWRCRPREEKEDARSIARLSKRQVKSRKKSCNRRAEGRVARKFDANKYCTAVISSRSKRKEMHFASLIKRNLGSMSSRFPKRSLSALVSNFIGSNLSGELERQNYGSRFRHPASFMWLFTSSQII